MVCIFCDIHINNNVLSSFVFSLQYLCHKNHRINQLIIGISESVQDLILCRCICGYCNVLCTRNLNLIELFHRPHRVPQTIFSTIVKQIYFCMAVACGGATVHKKSVFYCIILRAPKTQSNTGDLVFEKIP